MDKTPTGDQHDDTGFDADLQRLIENNGVILDLDGALYDEKSKHEYNEHLRQALELKDYLLSTSPSFNPDEYSEALRSACIEDNSGYDQDQLTLELLDIVRSFDGMDNDPGAVIGRKLSVAYRLLQDYPTNSEVIQPLLLCIDHQAPTPLVLAGMDEQEIRLQDYLYNGNRQRLAAYSQADFDIRQALRGPLEATLSEKLGHHDNLATCVTWLIHAGCHISAAIWEERASDLPPATLDRIADEQKLSGGYFLKQVVDLYPGRKEVLLSALELIIEAHAAKLSSLLDDDPLS